MCQLYGQPVGEYCSCCRNCNQYLSVCVPVVGCGGFVTAECDFSFCEYCPYYSECENLWGKGVDNMKLVNYESRTLIYQNVRSNSQRTSNGFTRTQFLILCRLIRRKHISRQFFDFLLAELYGISDWKTLTYEQMYELIHVLTYWNYGKERLKKYE